MKLSIQIFYNFVICYNPYLSKSSDVHQYNSLLGVHHYIYQYSLECKYIFPVTYPDTVHVGTRVTEIKNDRFVMQCNTYSEKHQRLAAISNHEVVTVNFQLNKKVSVPAAVKEAIEAIESGLKQ